MANRTRKNSVVAIYETHIGAEEAVKALDKAGFNMKQLSIVGQDFHDEQHVVGYYNSGDRMKYWGKLGAFWGGLWGLLLGSAFFWVPGIGPLLVAGPLATSILGGLEGAITLGGLSALAAGLYSLGIPRDSLLAFETAIQAGKYVLVAHGTPEQVALAKSIIEETEASDVSHHQADPPGDPVEDSAHDKPAGVGDSNAPVPSGA